MFARKIEKHPEDTFADLETARDYAESAQKSTMRYRAFFSTIQSLNIQGKYLDAGAGTGTVAAIVTQNNPEVEVTALEISPNMVTIGEEYIESKGLQSQVRFIVGDAVDKETSNKLGKFDLIYSTYSMHHWKNPGKVIDNLMSSLVENGILYVYDLRRVWWLYWIPIRNGFYNSIRAGYAREEIKELLKGFQLESFTIRNEFPFMQSVIIKKSG